MIRIKNFIILEDSSVSGLYGDPQLNWLHLLNDHRVDYVSEDRDCEDYDFNHFELCADSMEVE